MHKDEAGSPRQWASGLLVPTAVAVSGLLLLLLAQTRGASAWLFNAYLLATLAALFLYWAFVLQPQRELERRAAAAARTDSRIEDQLEVALDHLRAGDLVSCAQLADSLPGGLAASFSGAASAIEVLARQIQSSSHEVASTANAVNQLASELASGSSEQAASVVEITAAMEELARTAAEIAGNAAVQAEAAQRGEESGNAGAAAVEGAVDGVERVQQRIASIAGRAEALGARSQEIFRVLDLLTDIARETHILSLNAAIEAAAEAGEHGRRFALVAEEVRRLAQRSQEAADSVRGLLDEFAASIQATVAATEEGGTQAGEVLEQARATSAAIEELRSAAAETAQVAREISSATQEQNAASNEVVLTLREASEVVQQMAEGLKRFSDTARALNGLGLNMQMLAQSFRLPAPHSLKHTVEEWADLLRRRLGNWEAIEGLLQELVQQRPFVECLYFMDARGDHGAQVALVTNRTLFGDREVPSEVKEGIGFTQRPWYKDATSERRTILTVPFTSLLSGEKIITAATPLYEGGELQGVLGLDVNIEAWGRT